MKKIITIIFFFIATYTSYAQAPTFQWVKNNIGSQGSSYAESQFIVLDSSGNIFTVGYFHGTVDFNPSIPLYYGLTSITWGHSYYIQKLTASGNLVWVKQIDFAHTGVVKSIKVGDNGSLIIAGYYEDSVDFDPGTGVHMLYSNGDLDAFILKLSANGNFIWAKSFGGSEEDIIRDITVDNNGNIYSHGHYQDTVDFDPGTGICIYGAPYTYFYPPPMPLNNAFIQKLDKNGNFVWAKVFLNSEGGGGSHGTYIDLDSEGNIFCAGPFDGVGIDFDPGPGQCNAPANYSSMYIVKLDSSGSFIWARFNTYIGLYGNSYVGAIRTDRYNNIYATGVFAGNVDFDPGPDTLLLPGYSSNCFFVFIQKYDQNGNFLWAKSYGRENHTDPTSLSVDTFGNIYTTGFFWDSTDLDPGPDTLMFYTQGPGSYSKAGYIQKLNTNGDLLWVGIIQGNNGVSEASGVHVDNAENVFLTGKYIGIVDFDIGTGIHNSAYSNSFASYVLKLSQCKILTTDSIIACDSLTWMDSVTYYQSTQSAYFTLPSSTGCDSVIQLALTIPNIDTTISIGNYGGSFTSNQPGASYQWLDCNNTLAPLAGDTLQTFTPTLNGSYAVAIDVSGCVDTSACIPISNVGIEDITANKIKLYPNPNTGKFILDMGNLKATELKVFNSMGQEVFIARDNKSQYFNLDLQPGIYFMEIRSEKGNKMITFVVR